MASHLPWHHTWTYPPQLLRSAIMPDGRINYRAKLLTSVCVLHGHVILLYCKHFVTI